MYYEPYHFGSSEDIITVIDYNRSTFQKSFMCGVCALNSKDKLCVSETSVKLKKSEEQVSEFLTKFDLLFNYNNTERKYKTIYVWNEHLSKQFFIHDEEIFREIINFKLTGYGEDSQDSLGLWWSLESCSNTGDHIVFEEKALSKIKGDPTYVFGYDEVTNGGVYNFLLSEFNSGKYFDVFISDNFLYIYSVKDIKNLCINKKSFEFQRDTQNKNRCFHDEIDTEMNAHKSIVSEIKSQRKCIYSLQSCDKDSLNYASYLVSRFLTCKANESAKKHPLEVYSELLYDSIFYTYALETQSFVDDKIIDSPLATALIQKNINNLLTFNESNTDFGIYSEFGVPYIKDHRKMNSIKYRKSNGEPNYMGAASSFGAIVDAKFAGMSIVIKIDKNYDRENKRRSDADVFLHEFLVGMELNDEKYVPKTLGMFICPSDIGIETRNKGKFEMCKRTDNSVDTSFIILEKVDGINFYDYLQREKDEDKILYYIQEIFIILDRLYQKYGFLHSDLHFNNIMIDNKTERIKLIDLGFASTKNYFSGNELPVEGQIYMVLMSLMIDGARVMYNKFSRLEYLVTKFLFNSNPLKIKSINDYYDYIFVNKPKEINKERIGYDLRRDKQHFFSPFRDYSKFYYHSYEDVIKEINKLVEKK